MLLLVELLVFLAPVAGYALWRATLARGEGPSPRLLLGILAGLLLFGAGLVWFGLRGERLAPGERYVPAELRDGRVVPGHGG